MSIHIEMQVVCNGIPHTVPYEIMFTSVRLSIPNRGATTVIDTVTGEFVGHLQINEVVHVSSNPTAYWVRNLFDSLHYKTRSFATRFNNKNKTNVYIETNITMGSGWGPVKIVLDGEQCVCLVHVCSLIKLKAICKEAKQDLTLHTLRQAPVRVRVRVQERVDAPHSDEYGGFNGFLLAREWADKHLPASTTVACQFTQTRNELTTCHKTWERQQTLRQNILALFMASTPLIPAVVDKLLLEYVCDWNRIDSYLQAPPIPKEVIDALCSHLTVDGDDEENEENDALIKRGLDRCVHIVLLYIWADIHIHSVFT